MTDYLGDGDVADEHWQPTQREATWSHPATLAVTSIVLALLVLMGSNLFRGLLYTSTIGNDAQRIVELSGEQSDGPATSVVLGALLSAAFALLPLLLGLRGLRRLVPTDPAWTAAVLRAAVLLAGVALLLRSVLAVLVMTSDGSAFSVFSYASQL